MSKHIPVSPLISYVDLPEISETFADSFTHVHYDNNLLRIEFCTTRLDTAAPKEKPKATRVPSARMVFTAGLALALHDQLNKMVDSLKAQGHLRQIQQPTSEKPN